MPCTSIDSSLGKGWGPLTKQKLIKEIIRLTRARGLDDGDQLGLAIAALTQQKQTPSSTEIAGAIPGSFLMKNNLTKAKATALVEEALAQVPQPELSTLPQPVEIVAITALALEGRAVISCLKNVTETVHDVTGTIYYVGDLQFGKQHRRVAVVVGGEGNAAAAAETERALSFFKPTVALFVGVAGGLKDELALGDVVAASSVADYASAKATASKTLPRIKTHSAGYQIGQRANSVMITDSWKSNLVGTKAAEVKAFFKPIAAGPHLVTSTDSPTAVWIKEHCGDALAVEMEGFGFLQAGFAYAVTETLVVRGISDLVDGKDAKADAKWQPIAAHRAAVFALTAADELLDARGLKRTER